LSHRVSGTLSFSTQDDRVVFYSAERGEQWLQASRASQGGEGARRPPHPLERGAFQLPGKAGNVVSDTLDQRRELRKPVEDGFVNT
jgi:hypothetical protein